jgi:hypothetical protein
VRGLNLVEKLGYTRGSRPWEWCVSTKRLSVKQDKGVKKKKSKKKKKQQKNHKKKTPPFLALTPTQWAHATANLIVACFKATAFHVVVQEYFRLVFASKQNEGLRANRNTGTNGAAVQDEVARAFARVLWRQELVVDVASLFVLCEWLWL